MEEFVPKFWLTLLKNEYVEWSDSGCFSGSAGFKILYDRGVGVIPVNCPKGYVKEYRGTTCWTACPSGYKPHSTAKNFCVQGCGYGWTATGLVPKVPVLKTFPPSPKTGFLIMTVLHNLFFIRTNNMSS